MFEDPIQSPSPSILCLTNCDFGGRDPTRHDSAISEASLRITPADLYRSMPSLWRDLRFVAETLIAQMTSSDSSFSFLNVMAPPHFTSRLQPVDSIVLIRPPADSNPVTYAFIKISSSYPWIVDSASTTSPHTVQIAKDPEQIKEDVKTLRQSQLNHALCPPRFDHAPRSVSTFVPFFARTLPCPGLYNPLDIDAALREPTQRAITLDRYDCTVWVPTDFHKVDGIRTYLKNSLPDDIRRLIENPGDNPSVVDLTYTIFNRENLCTEHQSTLFERSIGAIEDPHKKERISNFRSDVIASSNWPLLNLWSYCLERLDSVNEPIRRESTLRQALESAVIINWMATLSTLDVVPSEYLGYIPAPRKVVDAIFNSVSEYRPLRELFLDPTSFHNATSSQEHDEALAELFGVRVWKFPIGDLLAPEPYQEFRFLQEEFVTGRLPSTNHAIFDDWRLNLIKEGLSLNVKNLGRIINEASLNNQYAVDRFSELLKSHIFIDPSFTEELMREIRNPEVRLRVLSQYLENSAYTRDTLRSLLDDGLIRAIENNFVRASRDLRKDFSAVIEAIGDRLNISSEAIVYFARYGTSKEHFQILLGEFRRNLPEFDEVLAAFFVAPSPTQSTWVIALAEALKHSTTYPNKSLEPLFDYNNPESRKVSNVIKRTLREVYRPAASISPEIDRDASEISNLSNQESLTRADITRLAEILPNYVDSKKDPLLSLSLPQLCGTLASLLIQFVNKNRELDLKTFPEISTVALNIDKPLEHALTEKERMLSKLSSTSIARPLLINDIRELQTARQILSPLIMPDN
jgi:hypothetical protein